MKRCPVCGSEAGDADKFCKQCSYVFPKTVHEKLDEIFEEIEKPKKEEEIEEELDEILASLEEEETEPTLGGPESRETMSLGRAPMATRETGATRAGRINGMTNGLTNGTFRLGKARREIKRREYRKIVVPLIACVLVITSLMALIS
ncbi:MAG: hypothetical protein QW531_05010, partial [Thermoplasmata archaeon]